MKQWVPACIIVLMASVLALQIQAEGEGKPRPKTYTGELGKVEGSNVTVIRKGDSGQRSETFTIASDTKIRLETTEDETVKVRGEGGEREVVRAKVVDAKIGDLKTGQRVTVTHTPDNKALDILGHRAPPKRNEG